jgi:ketosteroid isomerase-like protein
VDTRQAAQRWADTWERGWPDRDAEAIAALYAEDAAWLQHPFREAERDYLARVFAEEESAECVFEHRSWTATERRCRGAGGPGWWMVAAKISSVSRCCASTPTAS